MKRASLVLIVVALTIGVAAQPKVAVLDAIIPQNMDPSVIIPVTEKIMERMVISGRFNVLDRANIETVLREREFQFSGMVSDQDVTTAGKYLGADFVVVVKVQKIDDTYFVSAKMIAIKTGVIANQSSAQGEGKLSELINLAAQVGEVMSGGAVLVQSAAGDSGSSAKAPEREPEPAVTPSRSAPAPQPAPPAPSGAGKAYVGVSYVPMTWEETYSMNYDGVTTVDLSHSAIDLGFDAGYVMANVAIGFMSGVSYEDVYNGNTYSTDILDSLTYIGLGAFGKYPIPFGDMTVYPFAGLEYLMNMEIKNQDGEDISANLSYFGESLYNGRIFLEAGLGVEMSLGNNLYLRAQAAFGYKIPSQQDADYISWEQGYYSTYNTGEITTTLIKAGASVGFSI